MLNLGSKCAPLLGGGGGVGLASQDTTTRHSAQFGFSDQLGILDAPPSSQVREFRSPELFSAGKD